DVARPFQGRVAFAWYLLLVGVFAVLAYPLSCDVTPDFPGMIRYALLALLAPVAAFALFAERRPPRPALAVVTAAFCVWGAMNLVDNVRVIREYRTSPPPNRFRGLADYLVAHGIRYAEGSYWDSYVTDFYTRERTIVASNQKVRITRYQQQVDAHRDEA